MLDLVVEAFLVHGMSSGTQCYERSKPAVQLEGIIPGVSVFGRFGLNQWDLSDICKVGESWTVWSNHVRWLGKFQQARDREESFLPLDSI